MPAENKCTLKRCPLFYNLKSVINAILKKNPQKPIFNALLYCLHT